MRIRSSLLPRLVGLMGGLLVRAWLGTLRFRFHHADRSVDPRKPEYRGRYIYAFWHEMMLLPVYTHGGFGIHMLVSRHGDGDYIAQLGRAMGFRAVRGSTNRGGVQAIRQLMRQGQRFNLAITPDGPRGPRRRVQPGLVYVASRTGLPIVPIGFAFRRPWRLGSWDRFALPKPFSIAAAVGEAPIVVPPDLDRADIAHYRRRVQEAIDRATEQAEAWVETDVPMLAQPLLHQRADSAMVSPLSRTSL